MFLLSQHICGNLLQHPKKLIQHLSTLFWRHEFLSVFFDNIWVRYLLTRK